MGILTNKAVFAMGMPLGSKDIGLLGLPSGKRLRNYGKIHHFSWENPLFLWPFSIAMLNYQRVPCFKHGYTWLAMGKCFHQNLGFHIISPFWVNYNDRTLFSRFAWFNPWAFIGKSSPFMAARFHPDHPAMGPVAGCNTSPGEDNSLQKLELFQ